MFVVNDDFSIYATRGDIVCINLTATDDRSGEPYEFQPGDIVRMKIFGKNDAENVVMQKDFPVVAKTDTVGIFLTEDDTKIGEVISKPRDYWYEIELNPYSNPQTIIGYDEDGAKIFKLFPEGRDLVDEPTKPEDVPVVDGDLNLTSSRPVENRAIARAITLLKNDVDATGEKLRANEKSDRELKRRFDNLISGKDAAISKTLGYLSAITETTKSKIDGRIESDGVFANITVNLREANLIYGGSELELFIIPDECRPMETGLIHTEDGLEKILSTVKEFAKKRLIVVFGAAGERDAGKRKAMGECVARYADIAIVTSDNPRFEDPQLIIDMVLEGFSDCFCRVESYIDRLEAIKSAVNAAAEGDVIVLCGKGHEKYQVIGDDYQPFSEHDIIKELTESIS